MGIIEMSNVYYDYPDGSRGLVNMSINVEKGECLALVGPNGSGKTTVLLHLNGILTPREGSVSILGLQTNEDNLREVRSKVGVVFQNPDDQLFSPTVFDDVAFGPLNIGFGQGEVQERVKKALANVGMQGYERRSSQHLSFGEKKRISIATVLSTEPEILLLDEPTMGMDPWVKREFVSLLEELKKNHTTIIATHDEVLVGLCNRMVMLKDGRIADSDAWDELQPNLL
ncbi:MAG: ABC transporter ATP-binding protein [Candidatus Micrarchaeota archaeon]